MSALALTLLRRLPKSQIRTLLLLLSYKALLASEVMPILLLIHIHRMPSASLLEYKSDGAKAAMIDVGGKTAKQKRLDTALINVPYL